MPPPCAQLVAPSALSGLEDRECLRRYVGSRDEAAFRELVHRYLNLVHTVVARRLGGDAHSAQDVTQKVFTALARQAPSLAPDVVLPAWLYSTARHLAANWVRTEQRRRARERTAHLMDDINGGPDTNVEWEKLRPMLDDALDELGERDRSAVLLRFFAQRSFPEIGTTLQLSEDAARMRVDRALDRLHCAFARRGVKSSAGALAGILVQNAVFAAPAEMATTVATTAIAQSGWAATALTLMIAHKLPLGLTAAALITGTTCLTLLPSAESSPATATPSATAASSVPVAPATQVERIPGRPTSTATATPAAVPPTADAWPQNVIRRIQRLDALVKLAPQQQTIIAKLFLQEDEALAQFPSAERPEKGNATRLSTRDQIRAVLTIEQRRIYDGSPQSASGGLSIDLDKLVARLNETVTLTPEQKAKTHDILWAEIVEQASALNDDAHLNGFRWRDTVRRRLREILSPAQQTKFDQTRPYRLSR